MTTEGSTWRFPLYLSMAMWTTSQEKSLFLNTMFFSFQEMELFIHTGSTKLPWAFMERALHLHLQQQNRRRKETCNDFHNIPHNFNKTLTFYIWKKKNNRTGHNKHTGNKITRHNRKQNYFHIMALSALTYATGWIKDRRAKHTA